MNNEIIKNRVERNNFIPIFIIGGLLFLRFPFIFAGAANIIPKNNMMVVYIGFTYLLTALLILLEKDRLADFNIDFSSIFLFILIPIVKPLIFIILKYPIFSNQDSLAWSQISWFQFVFAIILLVALIYVKPGLFKRKMANTFLWFVISILVSFLFVLIEAFIFRRFSQQYNTATLSIFVYLFFVQFTNAAIVEEPLFRGFICGYLKRKNWKAHSVILLQALLFCIGHLYYLPSAPGFFILSFVAGVVLGLVAWLSQSISNSMIVHGLINSLGDIFINFNW